MSVSGYYEVYNDVSVDTCVNSLSRKRTMLISVKGTMKLIKLVVLVCV